MREWFRRPATAADAWVSIGLAIAALVSVGARVGAMGSMLAQGAAADATLRFALVAYGACTLLALPHVIPWLPLALAASNAGWTTRRLLGSAALMLATTLAAGLYAVPLSLRLIGTVATGVAGGTFRYPDDPSTWLGHELIVAALTGRAPVGSEMSDASGIAPWMLGNALFAALLVASLVAFLVPPRPRWPWPVVALLCAASLGVEALGDRWVGDPALQRDQMWAPLWTAACIGLVFVVVALAGRALARSATNVVPSDAPRPSRLRRLALLVAGAVLGGAFILAPVVGRGGVASATKLVVPEPGTPAPLLALDSIDGRTVSLEDHRGRVVVVSFWATWCGPCRRELPVLQALQDELGPRGLVVLAVDVSESRDQIASELPTIGARLDVLLSTPAVLEAYGVEGLPSTFLIASDGRIARHHLGFGPGTEADLRQEIAALMAAGP